MKRWDKPLSSALIGLFLVGCSLLSVQRSPADQAFDAPRPEAPQAAQAPQVLKPGLSPVVVEAINRSGATIVWKSPWEGQSQVRFAESPRLESESVRQTPVTVNRRVQLSQLRPNTRYYFQVETRTAVGTARSAVLSFRTR